MNYFGIFKKSKKGTIVDYSSQIEEILKEIEEPILKNNFSGLGFVKKIEFKDGEAKLELGISDLSYGKLYDLENRIKEKISARIKEVKTVTVNWVLGIVEHKSKQKDIVLPGIKNTIAIASGKGGVGKSTVAVNLAMALKLHGAKVGLIDADIYGPSIPIMFGVTERPMVVNRDGKNKMLPIVKYDIKLMSIGFLMEEDTAVVWRGPMASSALKQFMSEVLWGDLDFLLFDMPPGTGDIQLTLSQTIPLTGAVIVTTPQDIALTDARKGHIMFEKVNVPTLGFIENMSYYVRGDGNKDYIFGQGGGEKISKEFNVPLLGEIAIDTAIRQAGDIGKPIVLADPSALASKQFMEISRNLIHTINIKNSASSNKGDLEIII